MMVNEKCIVMNLYINIHYLIAIHKQHIHNAPIPSFHGMAQNWEYFFLMFPKADKLSN